MSVLELQGFDPDVIAHGGHGSNHGHGGQSSLSVAACLNGGSSLSVTLCDSGSNSSTS